MLNVRLNQKMEEELNSYSKENNISKSSIVKEALTMYFKKDEMSQSPFELGEGLFGSATSDNPDASTTYKQRLKQRLHEKHSH